MRKGKQRNSAGRGESATKQRRREEETGNPQISQICTDSGKEKEKKKKEEAFSTTD